MNVSREDIMSVFKSENISVDVSGLKSNDSLRDAGLDSLDMMSFFLGIEQKFNVKISDDDLETLDTVDKIVSYLKQL